MTRGIFLAALSGLLVVSGCSTTQKTAGEGMTSVVAQNVVRIAIVQGLRGVDFSLVESKAVMVSLTGFADNRNRGILELLFRSRVEDAGGRLVNNPAAADLQIEVAVLSAGNDQGGGFGLLLFSERTESLIDLQMTARDRAGEIQYSQAIKGEAKYEQTSFLVGIDKGRYKVKNENGIWEDVPDPGVYR